MMPRIELPARAWMEDAIRLIEADYNRSADTHLLPVGLPHAAITLYLKDESTHPTGSLKHRLARSLFLYALCNGWIGPETTIVESSSGSTAVSEAYFARMLGLRFIAVMPRSTSAEKVAQIRFHGGECHFVDSAAAMYAESGRLAAELGAAAPLGGHYMDQFTYAERATDWRGNNNIAESIFSQMAREADPVPRWIVVGAGTGGTSATLGRYIRFRRHPTRLCLVDPEPSVFHRVLSKRWSGSATTDSAPADPNADPASLQGGPTPSCIEGIGRPRPEPSFIPSLIDHCVVVPDAASIAAARVLSRRLGRLCGGSTGTNLWGAAQLISAMAARGERGSVVTLLCDSGERYRSTLHDDAWLGARSLDIAGPERAIETFFETGHFAP